MEESTPGRALYGWHRAGRWIVVEPEGGHWVWQVHGGVEIYALRKREGRNADRETARKDARASAFDLERSAERMVQVLANWLWFDQGDLVDSLYGRASVQGMARTGLLLVTVEADPVGCTVGDEMQVLPATVRKVRAYLPRDKC